jgi:alpha-galactosidase
MPKVTIMGAGSNEFAAELTRDILATPALEQGSFALVDIDAERLELAHRMVERLIEQTGRDWTVEASTERTKVLAGSDYLINAIEVAGLANVRHDYDIPLKYGVDQCIGDTIGPGGLFKALRTLPAWIEILEDTRRLAPGCLVMNYTNPMSLTVLTGVRHLQRGASLTAGESLPSIVGLCHSVQHTSMELSVYLDVPYPELRWRVGGINHLAWFVELSREGKDQYPRLRERAHLPEIYEQDPVRLEIMLHLGAFPTESSGHVSEYVSYFRKRPDLIQRYMRSEYRGESGFYADNWPSWRAGGDARTRRFLEGQETYPLTRGPEYASYIIEAIQTRRPAVIYGNVLNTGLISNLPGDGVVEVACLVDGGGIQPVHFGALPPQLAALNHPHMVFHDLVATAVLEQDREAAIHALMIDPLTSAVCSLAEIRQMFAEMAAAQRNYLPEFVTRA